MQQRLPLAPFAGWPVQIFDERIGFIWYARPAAFVTQSVVEHGSLEALHLMNDYMDQVIAARPEELALAGGLLVFHDWRTIRTYDKAARTQQVERMRRRAKGYSRGAVVVVAPKNRLLRMAIEAANLVVTIALGSRIELATDVVASLARQRLEAPRPGEPLPGSSSAE